MKHISLLLLLGLWLAPGRTTAQTATTSADSVNGQTLLAREAAATACQRLTAQAGTTNFQTLSPAKAQDLFEQALSNAITSKDKKARRLVQGKVASTYEKLISDLTTLAAIELIRICAPAALLYRHFSDTASAEQEFVQSWGDELCQRLNTLDQQGKLKGQTAAQRMELFRQEYEASLHRRGPQIMQLYGPAGNSTDTVARLGTLLMEHMQTNCLQTLLLLRGPQ